MSRHKDRTRRQKHAAQNHGRAMDAKAFLPMSPAEMDQRGWSQPDIVFVSGDAYIDHPSFAAALLCRLLEAQGYKVAILAQPDWNSAEPWREMGRPRICYMVSAGNMDSMINHYTANRKRRNDDSYSPGGKIGLRPDRPTNVYAQRCREAFAGVPVIAGGVEASLRRIAHYDYWSDTVRPSILVTSKADIVGYGMGETLVLEIVRRLAEQADRGEPPDAEVCRDMRGVSYMLGKKDPLPEHEWHDACCDNKTIPLPSFEEVKSDPMAFAEATRIVHMETSPLNGRRHTQQHGDRTVVINPPTLPLKEQQMDDLYDLPYTRRPHPSYGEPIPAHTMIKDSISIMRGCFGGCTFCSITLHQGRIIQSRSKQSVVREIEKMTEDPDFKGHISDLGGPTANMYQMRCTRPEIEARCRRQSCVHPTVCKLLGTDHKPTTELMRAARKMPGVKSVRIASGIRMDLARHDDEYLDELVEHHVGGQLKVAPEHVSDTVLTKMKKPAQHTFEEFEERFAAASKRAGKEQYLVPYFIASHPGSGVAEMIDLAVFLKRRGYKPRQVQDFIPAPMDVATCMYYAGIDPFTKEPVDTAKKLKDRVVQRSLMQFFKPENWFTVRKALLDHGRKDLIGAGPDCLIPDNPPKEALTARREGARKAAGHTYVHADDAGTSRSVGGARKRAGHSSHQPSSGSQPGGRGTHKGGSGGRAR